MPYKDYEKTLENNRKLYNDNPERYKKYKLKSKYKHCANYNETMEVYNQVSHCECCGKPFGDLRHNRKCVDHYADIIRGLICDSCNTAIGKLGDTPEGIRNALDYLNLRHPIEF